MAFHVIHLAAGLDRSEEERARVSGPPFVHSDLPYPDLMDEAGFAGIEESDVTDHWRVTQKAWLVESGRVLPELEEVYGDETMAESQKERRDTLAAIDAGLLKRSLYVTS